MFLFCFVFHDYFLFVGEDILDSAVYSRGGENTNGYTNGDNVDGQRGRADVSSPILPEYGAGNLGKKFLSGINRGSSTIRFSNKQIYVTNLSYNKNFHLITVVAFET